MDELTLVKQVELKLLLINDPAKFSAAIDLYLCPLLLKIASPSREVGVKVLNVLEHINARLNDSITLPSQKLLAQLQDPTLPASVKRLTLVYLKKTLKQPFPDLLAQLAKGIHEQNDLIKPDQFALLLTAWTLLPPEFVPETRDLDFLIAATTKLLLVDLKYLSKGKCPGLSTADFSLVAADLNELKLSTAKGKICEWYKFLAESKAVKPSKLFVPLVIAQEDRLSQVYGPAKTLFKSLGLQNATIPNDVLLSLAALVTPNHTTEPVKTAIIVRILDVISKSDASVLKQLDFYALVHPAVQSSDQKWAQSVFAILRSAATKKVDIANVMGICEDLREYLYLLETSYGGSDTTVRSSAYETLGSLLGGGTHPVSNLSLIRFLFQRLERDPIPMLPSIQSALNAILRNEIAVSLHEELAELLFKAFISSERDATKYSCVRYAIRVFAFDHAPSRYICLAVQQPAMRSDVAEEGRRGSDPFYFAKERDLNPDSLVFPSPESISLLLEQNPVENPGPVLSFIFKCMATSAGVTVVRDEKWEKNFWVSVQFSDACTTLLRQYFRGSADPGKLFGFCVGGLVQEDSQCNTIWTLLLRVCTPEQLAGQAPLVPSLLTALESSKSVPINLIAESIALLYDESRLEDLVLGLQDELTPAKALLLCFLVKLRSCAFVPLQYCLDNKLWDALYQLGLAMKLEPTPQLLESLSVNSEKQMAVYSTLALCNPAEAQSYLDKLLELATNSKNLDFLLANGEAISICVSGWDSDLLKYERKPSSPISIDLVSRALVKIFKDARASPVLRRYACVRLLCLVQYNFKVISPYISDIQQCFLTFLTDADEISQESSSNGLGILYEQSSRETRKDLVKQLVSMFTDDGSKKPLAGGRISNDTQLFEPGVLNTGEGSVSTYKDVLSLASEVGDSSLVYKFMSLAASSQIWSSKRGAAFGLESIMAKAEISDDLVSPNSKTAKNLVPKLYRYQFDSNPNVKNVMKTIWDAVVKNKQKTIADHFESIVKELFESCANYEWRIREASALAFANLVETTNWDLFGPWTEQLWQSGFRLVDDIKDSVRAAGYSLTKALVSVLTRRLDSQARGNAELLDTLIPFLFSTKGVHNDSEEVRNFALSALLKISTSGAADINPLKLDLIAKFTLLLSDMEPQTMNYIALNTSNLGVEDGMVDEVRMQQVKASPIQATLEKLIVGLDNKQMVEMLQSKWPDVVKQAVGLPSEIGASNVIVLVCMRYPLDGNVSPLMNVCKKQLTNRNPAVAQSYAIALAYLSRLAPLNIAEDYVKHVVSLYFNEEATTSTRLVTSQCIKALSSHASDRFMSLSALTLPFAYIGKHDDEEAVASVFEQAWDSNTGGSESLRLYSTEIVEMAAPHLTSASWNLRKACAKALKRTIPNTKFDQDVVDQFLSALQGRTWPGKQFIFEAFAETSNKYADFGPELKAQVQSRVTNELQRENGEYVLAIIPAVGLFLRNAFNKEIYDLFFKRIVAAFTAKLRTDEPMTDDDKIKLLEAAVDTFTDNSSDQQMQMDEILSHMFVGWKLKKAACEGLARLAAKSYFSRDSWQKACTLCGRDYGHEVVRLAWLDAAIAMQPFGIAQDVVQTLATETSPVVQTKAKTSGFL